MKAMMLVEKSRLEITDMPMPTVGDEDLLVRIKACGICGSDVHGFDGSTGRRIPPIVMGHEASGVVERTGTNAKRFRSGDRVTFDSTIYCGQCAYCQAGKVNLCENRRVLGVSCGDYRQHGCFAEYASIPQRIAYHLPESLSFEHAAMVEAVSIAMHAVRRAAPAPGDPAVVVGVGMVGQLIVQVLRAAECGTLIAVDVDESRLERARKLGADHLLSAESPDLIETICRLTSGGAAAAFEVVGIDDSFQTAASSVRKGGALVLVGNLSPKVRMPLQVVVTRELTLLGSCASAGEYPACLDAMAKGKIDVQSLISAVAPLEQGPQWFARLHAGETGLMKIILNP